MALGRKRSEDKRLEYERSHEDLTRQAAETFSKKNEDGGSSSEYDSVLHMDPISLVEAVRDAPIIHDKPGGAAAELDAFRAKTSLRVEGHEVISKRGPGEKSASAFDVALWKQSPIASPGAWTTLTDWREDTEALRTAFGHDITRAELHEITQSSINFDWERAIMEHTALFTRQSSGKSAEEKARDYRYITISVQKKAEQFFPNMSTKADDDLQVLEKQIAEALDVGERAFSDTDTGAAAAAAAGGKPIDVLDAKDAKAAERAAMTESGSEPGRKADPLGHFAVIAGGPILALDYDRQLEKAQQAKQAKKSAALPSAAGVSGTDHKELPPVNDAVAEEGFVDEFSGKLVKSWHEFLAVRQRVKESMNNAVLLTVNRDILYDMARTWAAKATQFNSATRVDTACILFATNAETTMLEPPKDGSSQAFTFDVRLGLHVTNPIIDKAEAEVRYNAAVSAAAGVLQSEAETAERAKAGSIVHKAQLKVASDNRDG